MIIGYVLFHPATNYDLHSRDADYTVLVHAELREREREREREITSGRIDARIGGGGGDEGGGGTY